VLTVDCFYIVFYFELDMALLSQRGKEMYRDEYNFIYTLNGKK